MKHRQKTALLAMGMALLLGTGVELGFAQESTGAHDQSALLDAMFQSSADDSFTSLIKDATVTASSGGKGLMYNKDIDVLAYDDIPQKVLEGNHNIKLADIGVNIADSKKDEADAFFYPSFNASFTYSVYDSYDRKEEIGRYHTAGVVYDPVQECFINEANGEPVLPGIYDSTNDKWLSSDDWDLTYSVQTEYASVRADYPSYPEDFSGTLGVAQSLKWGQYLNLGLLVGYRNVTYPSLGGWGMLYGYEDSSYPFGKRPWASTLSGSIQTPFPYTKDFGESGFKPSVDTKHATLYNEQQVYNRKNAVNDLIADAQIAYWDLVKAVKQLYILQNQQAAMDDLLARTKRLYDDGMRTNYDMVQMETTHTQIQNRTEMAWTDMVVASNKLAELLGQNPDDFIFPVNYIATLKERFEADEKASLAEADAHRPDLQMATIDFELSSLMEEYAKNQTLPDIKLIMNLGLSQSNSIYGYKDLGDSLGHLGDPDNVQFFLGFTYSLPWGNDALESSYRQAKAQKRKSAMQVELSRNSMTKEINMVTAKSISSQRQIETAASNLRLRQFAYDKANELREYDQQISDFELLVKFNELLDARLRYLSALVEYRKVYVQLQASTGTLSATYAPELGEDN